MNRHRLEDMVRGWFVGHFEPTVLDTTDVEVGVKIYDAGSYEQWHFHKVATEITVIVSGEAEFNGHRYGAGDIITINPMEGTDFRAITDVINVVVKFPGASADKYEVREPGVSDAAELRGQL